MTTVRRIRIGAEPHLPEWIVDDETGEAIPCCTKVVVDQQRWMSVPALATLHRLDIATGEEVTERVMVMEIAYPVYPL